MKWPQGDLGRGALDPPHAACYPTCHEPAADQRDQ